MASVDLLQPSRSGSPSPSPDPESEPTVSITVTLAGITHTFHLPESGTVDDLTLACEDAFGAETYSWTTHKFIAPPPVGLLKAGEHGDSALAPLAGKKLRLLAAKLSDVDSLLAAEQTARRRRHARRAARRQNRQNKNQHHASSSSSHRHHGDVSSSGSSAYTFMSLRPLPHMPHPERSLALLERLRDDRGIREVMRRRKFAVGLLTEMDPAAHTTASHEGVGRTLGLNRNRGEVIELRLRTDAGDGYRDYRTIRKTLCHELAHNVFGPHDRDFWDLCHAIEREVDAADWSAGRTVGGGGLGITMPGGGPPGAAGPDYDEDEEDDVPDHGGWTGGEFVLGGGGAGGAGGATAAASGAGLSRREILAKAAEERRRKLEQDRRDGAGGQSGT